MGGQSDVEGPVEPSCSEPEPIQEADLARMSGAFRDALRRLDQIDVVHFFSVRAVVMKSPPKFVRGAHNAAMRIALQEIEAGVNPTTQVARGHAAETMREHKRWFSWVKCLAAGRRWMVHL